MATSDQQKAVREALMRSRPTPGKKKGITGMLTAPRPSLMPKQRPANVSEHDWQVAQTAIAAGGQRRSDMERFLASLAPRPSVKTLGRR